MEAAETARIIPARAGFTPTRTRSRSPATDHPRSRGVYLTGPAVKGALTGSSPLARGLLAEPGDSRGEFGIIPARAGFTQILGHAAHRWQDHPRSRGVYERELLREPGTHGSSPLARGLRSVTATRWSGRGIIPARAGFTGMGVMVSIGSPDHPRSRGVYGARPWCARPRRGSSPLARGLHRRGPAPRPPARIIPARAGFTE